MKDCNDCSLAKSLDSLVTKIETIYQLNLITEELSTSMTDDLLKLNPCIDCEKN